MSTSTPVQPRFQCRHVFTSGHRCGSPALRQESSATTTTTPASPSRTATSQETSWAAIQAITQQAPLRADRTQTGLSGRRISPTVPSCISLTGTTFAPGHQSAIRLREDPTLSEPLITYLNDHLGGAQIAIQLLEGMRSQHDDPAFQQFAAAMLPEIKADEITLRSIMEKLGHAPSAIKQAGGWLAEKFARAKLGLHDSHGFALFQSLELLALGIQGKLSLWKALQEASSLDTRLREFDFPLLIRRAQQQYDAAEAQRLNLARTVLASVTLKPMPRP